MAEQSTRLNLEDVSLRFGDACILRDVALSLHQGELAVLVGPNGAGKSSLMHCALGMLYPTNGRATINDLDASSLPPQTRARLISYLPQMRPLAWPVTVRDVVALGRFVYGASPSALSPKDDIAVTNAIENCQLQDLADRRTDTLSGGELARMHCARAFAAEAPLLLADEPVAALDPYYQFSVMELFRGYVDRNGGGALVILHDISLAARFADRIIWLKDGTIIADGPPNETLTVDHMKTVFGMTAEIGYQNGMPDLKLTGVAM